MQKYQYSSIVGCRRPTKRSLLGQTNGRTIVSSEMNDVSTRASWVVVGCIGLVCWCWGGSKGGTGMIGPVLWPGGSASRVARLRRGFFGRRRRRNEGITAGVLLQVVVVFTLVFTLVVVF